MKMSWAVIVASVAVTAAAGRTNMDNIRRLQAWDSLAGPFDMRAWEPCAGAGRFDGHVTAAAARYDCATVAGPAPPRHEVEALWAGIVEYRHGRRDTALATWRASGVDRYFVHAALLDAVIPIETTRLFAVLAQEVRPDADTMFLAGRRLRDFDLPLAESALRRAVALDQSRAAAHEELALVLARRANHREAAAEYAAAAALDPTRIDAWRGRGESLFYTGDVAGALESFERAAARAGEPAGDLFWIGRCHLALGDEPAARRAFNRSRALAPALGPRIDAELQQKHSS